MPKSKRTTAIVDLAEQLEIPVCCSNRNCPSHWHDRLAAKLKKKTSSICKSNHQPKLVYDEILSKLFQIHELNEKTEGIYSVLIEKKVLLNKHHSYLNQITKTWNDLTYSFIQRNLNIPLKYRMLSLVADPYSYQIDQMEKSTELKINLLQTNHLHGNCYLVLKVISLPIWNRYAVHVIVQDENSHCLRLTIYHWRYVVTTRQSKSSSYIQERLKILLPLNSTIILLNPWLKKCDDGEFALRCESPNTHLLLKDFHKHCLTASIEQLRQWGNACYQADDNLSAIEYYTFGLRQLDEQQKKDLTSKGQSIGPKTDEREQHRIRLLSNRCACYLRERQAALALADSSIFLSLHDLSHILDSPKATTRKLLFRCLSAHLYLGLYNKVEGLLKSHQLAADISGAEHLSSLPLLNKELIRLKNEATDGRYDLQGLLEEQISQKFQTIFTDLSHHHAEYRRTDLFQIRLCQANSLGKTGYPHGSYGVYALKDLQAGTLLIIEQPLASVNNRIAKEESCHAINFWKQNSKMDYCSDETLSLLNEIEKLLLIGGSSSITLEKIQFLQPIRQWLAENSVEQHQDDENTPLDVEEDDDDWEQLSPEKKQWSRSSTNRSPCPVPLIPWHILFQTQQQNPYKSQSTLAWYPLGSMFNHACLPNCIWYLIGDYLFVYVCGSNIQQGEELTISYCPLWISSINERAKHLRRYDILSCQCALCLYDRSRIEEYEYDLKKFSNIRALTRQRNLSSSDRCRYLIQLKDHYEHLTNQFRQRPIGFMSELIDIEHLSNHFPDGNNHSFLQRLNNLCDLSSPNPILFFGPQTQLLIHHLEHFSSSDDSQWTRLLEHLYDVYTFKCYSSSNDVGNTFQDHKKLFSNLYQTQTFLQRPFLINVEQNVK